MSPHIPLLLPGQLSSETWAPLHRCTSHLFLESGTKQACRAESPAHRLITQLNTTIHRFKHPEHSVLSLCMYSLHTNSIYAIEVSKTRFTWFWAKVTCAHLSLSSISTGESNTENKITLLTTIDLDYTEPFLYRPSRYTEQFYLVTGFLKSNWPLDTEPTLKFDVGCNKCWNDGTILLNLTGQHPFILNASQLSYSLEYSSRCTLVVCSTSETGKIVYPLTAFFFAILINTVDVANVAGTYKNE